MKASVIKCETTAPHPKENAMPPRKQSAQDHLIRKRKENHVLQHIVKRHHLRGGKKSNEITSFKHDELKILSSER
jgi:hypothetical protein